MKAIIPVAGLGSRLRPHTHTQPKSLIPVAGKPILAHIIDYLLEIEVEEFIFIIGYMGDKIEKYITENYPDLKTFYVVQTNGKGTGHAIWLARNVIADNDELLIVFGDTIFSADKNKIRQSGNVFGVKEVDDPRLFGVAEVHEDGKVSRVIEKPNIPKSNQAMIGVYKFDKGAELKNALNHIIDNDLKNKGEYHLTDAINYMINNGSSFHVFDVDTWFDCGKKDILLETNAILLKKSNFKNDDSTIQNCILVPPVFIGKGSVLKNSIIGPNVSIGSNSMVNYCIVKNSIIGNESDIDDVHLNQSVVGNDNNLKGSSLSLNLGDSTEIRMNY